MRTRAARAAFTVTLAAGLVAGVSSSARADDVRAGYDCAFPAGSMRVAATVSATFPGRAAIGRPFRPTGVRTTLVLPGSALAQLPDGSTSVAADTSLTVAVRQGGQSASAGWLGSGAAVSIPASGGVTPVTTGAVPSVTVGAAGTVSFRATRLALTLYPYRADGSSAAPVKASCTPVGGPVTLGSVPVPAATPSQGPSAAPSSAGSSPGTEPTQPVPTGSGAVPHGTAPAGRSTVHAPLVAPRSGVGSFDPVAYRGCGDRSIYPTNVQQPIGVYLDGYANLTKLSGAAVIGYPEAAVARSTPDEGAMSVQSDATDFSGQNYRCARASLELDNGAARRLPPVTATVAGFGFMPVTATAHLSQVGDRPLLAVVLQDQGSASAGTSALDDTAPYTVVTTATVSLRLSDVRVNGQPLDVGPDCRTSRPLYTPDSPADPDDDRIVTTGGDSLGQPTPVYSQIYDGGAQTGKVTIPPFTGCVTPSGDNLDRLLTATVSGPGNATRLVQGPTCPNTPGCPQDDTHPIHPVTWTLTHGGTFTAAAPLMANLRYPPPGGGANKLDIIHCATSSMSGVSYNGSGAWRDDPMRLSWRAADCTSTRGETWSIDQQGSAGFDGIYYDPTTGATTGRAVGTTTMTRTEPTACTLTIGNTYGVTYTNTTGTLQLSNIFALGVGEKAKIIASSCPDISTGGATTGGGGEFSSQAFFAATYTVPPDQAFTLTSP